MSEENYEEPVDDGNTDDSGFTLKIIDGSGSKEALEDSERKIQRQAVQELCQKGHYRKVQVLQARLMPSGRVYANCQTDKVVSTVDGQPKYQTFFQSLDKMTFDAKVNELRGHGSEGEDIV